MGRPPYTAAAVQAADVPVVGGGAGTGGAFQPTTGRVAATSSGTAPAVSAATWSAAPSRHLDANVYTQMAADFTASIVDIAVQLDPVYRFPVLLHWSFTSFGDTTFRSLMEGLDSGLLGTVPPPAPPGSAGSAGSAAKDPRLPPLEIVETGHVGLPHRLRRGDPVRSWYRGPFVAHPTTDPPAGRLPLAHAADQLRIVVPDGREDVSLAAAFDIGRLLALARPSMIAALMRWRQTGYQTKRTDAVWGEFASFLTDVLHIDTTDATLSVRLGRSLAGALLAQPARLLGDPRPLVDAGRPLAVPGPPEAVLAAGFGLDRAVLSGDPATVLGRLRDTPVLLPDRAAEAGHELAAGLAATLQSTVDRLVAGIANLPEAGFQPEVNP
jgi:hypothetical protein